MYLIFPGRHQLLTNFQFSYLHALTSHSQKKCIDINGNVVDTRDGIQAIIFAVTSSNHSNTRRNPIPFYLRALALHEFARELYVPSYIYGIDDVGALDNFATYTLKRIKHESEGRFDLNPSNALVVCSTPVLESYERLGFKILPAELEDRQSWRYQASLPWDVIERVANDRNWNMQPDVLQAIHPASRELFEKYKLDEKISLLFSDKMIGEDGDITTTRDYNSYVRQMDEIAELKYTETAPFVRSGRIGDIGCAVGSWIKLACQDERYRESDFYGIEVARHLFDICNQRKHNGEFVNPFVFFSQRNAVTGLVFEPNSMNTIHTSSLTHEIESYGSRAELLQFIRNRYQELTIGGVWINRDVVGPFEKNKMVWMRLNHTDGQNIDDGRKFSKREDLRDYLKTLSTFARFHRFVADFRHAEGYRVIFRERQITNEVFIELSLRDACEFMSRKDYLDNWESEMHETFCFWDFDEWVQVLGETGFKVLPESQAYANEWIIQNRLKGKVELYEETDAGLIAMDFPVTNMIIIAEKQP